MKEEQDNRLLQKFRRELGPDLVAALDDPEIIEIDLNQDGKVWVERLFAPAPEHYCDLSPNQAVALFGTIAHNLGAEANSKQARLNGELPFWGCRFSGHLPPLVANPTFSIRKKATKIFTLDEYEESGAITTEQKAYIRLAIAAHKNILVAGSTSSGKTTFCNAVIDGISDQFPLERLLILEDTDEIQCKSINHNKYRSDPDNGVEMQVLLHDMLRNNPDRITFGEVRAGADALELLKAWNTGHPGGVATLHADSAIDALQRVEEMIGEVTSSPMTALVGRAVDVIVFMEKVNGKRGVSEIIEVHGSEINERGATTYITEKINSEQLKKPEAVA